MLNVTSEIKKRKMELLARAIVILALSFLASPPWAYSEELNKFYENFIYLLKHDDNAKLETLVSKNPGLAAKCLNAVEARIRKEDDKGKIQGYTMVADELKELIAVAADKKDCSFAESVYERGVGLLGAPQRIKAFSRTVRLCPGHDSAYVSLGETYRKTGDFDNAVLNYEKALSVKQDSPEALMGLGETLLDAGLFQRSLNYFGKVLAIDPENVPAKRLMAIASKQVAEDQPGFLLASEIEDKLSAGQESLMCMCPQFAKLAARLRLHEVTFEIGSAAISSKAIQQLEELATALKSDALKGGHYIIEGHADNIGLSGYNRVLSQERAEAVKSFLINKKGVSPSILSTLGAGDARSWTTNETYLGRRANRRIDILSVDTASAKSKDG